MCRASVAAVRLAGSVALKDPTHIRLQNGLIRLQACFPNRVQIWSLADVASIPRMTRTHATPHIAILSQASKQASLFRYLCVSTGPVASALEGLLG